MAVARHKGDGWSVMAAVGKTKEPLPPFHLEISEGAKSGLYLRIQLPTFAARSTSQAGRKEVHATTVRMATKPSLGTLARDFSKRASASGCRRGWATLVNSTLKEATMSEVAWAGMEACAREALCIG